MSQFGQRVHNGGVSTAKFRRSRSQQIRGHRLPGGCCGSFPINVSIGYWLGVGSRCRIYRAGLALTMAPVHSRATTSCRVTLMDFRLNPPEQRDRHLAWWTTARCTRWHTKKGRFANDSPNKSSIQPGPFVVQRKKGLSRVSFQFVSHFPSPWPVVHSSKPAEDRFESYLRMITGWRLSGL